MRLAAARPMYRRDAQFGGLKKIFRKIAGPAAAAAAVASGNPQLAVPAYNAGKAVGGKKKAKVQAPVEALPPPSWLDTLPTGDRNALLIGGAVVGTLLVSKLLTGKRR